MNEPNTYSQNHSLQTTDNIYVIENFLSLIKWENGENQTALDVGCGEGHTTAEILLPKLPKCLKTLIGSDLSEKMVQFAKDTYKNQRLDFCQLDISEGAVCKEFGDMFNHVFSFFCLHWIVDQRKVFENIFKLMKPGGDMLLSFLGRNPIFEVYQNISQNIHWAPYFKKEMVSPYHECEDPQQVIMQMLMDVGFSNWKCVVADRTYVYKNWRQLKASITAVNPTLPQLAPHERAQYIEDLTQEVRNIYKNKFKLLDNNNDEYIPVDYKLIIVYAVKPHNGMEL
ncbi:juvenile hormone acid O-methyltransferase [Euwallacea similis]|uniref:juvenile hormone acid O-methyltransferase n=1 Tax=Euwallacea similis TaxID=1736056 RepID=UPI00344D2C90